jgi:hypothetical protein
MVLDVSDAMKAAIAIPIAILVATLLVSCAIAQHGHVIHHIAGDQIFEAAASRRIDSESWQGVIEQIASDALRQPMRVASFASLAMDRTPCIRFVLHDGRLLEFKAERSIFSERHVFSPVKSPHICGELHAVCTYFAQRSVCDGAVPRNLCWQMRVVEPASMRLPVHSKRALPHKHL